MKLKFVKAVFSLYREDNQSYYQVIFEKYSDTTNRVTFYLESGEGEGYLYAHNTELNPVTANAIKLLNDYLTK